MYLVGPKGDQWSVDEGMRDRAAKLITAFESLVGHVVLDQVIFMRLSGSSNKWHGMCYYVGRIPIPIISKYVAYKLNSFGLLNLNGASFDLEDMDIFDIRYIIVLNDDAIGEAMDEVERVEDVTLLHELMHIHPDGDKLLPHDTKDFSALLSKFGPYWGRGVFNEDGKDEMDSLLADDDDFSTPLPPFMPISGSGGSLDPDESD